MSYGSIECKTSTKRRKLRKNKSKKHKGTK